MKYGNAWDWVKTVLVIGASRCTCVGDKYSLRETHAKHHGGSRQRALPCGDGELQQSQELSACSHE